MTRGWTRTRALATAFAALVALATTACSGAADGEAPSAADVGANPSDEGGSGTDDGGTSVAKDGGAGDAVSEAASPNVLLAPVAMLAAEVATRSPGTEVAIAVADLKTGEVASHAAAERHVSASSPKAIWVAAALDKSGIAAVTPVSGAIFEDSDNAAAGTAIDLAGGIDAVNVFYKTKAGMTDSAMAQWSGRVATNSPRKMGSDNYFTARDALEFLVRLERGTLLAPALTTQLKTWMTTSPRTGFGGWLGTLLPPAARATMMHKAGWLPPGCCGDDTEYNTLNEIGLVEVGPGHVLAVSILARRGADWYGKQAPWVERASCVLFRAAASQPSLACRD